MQGIPKRSGRSSHSWMQLLGPLLGLLLLLPTVGCNGDGGNGNGGTGGTAGTGGGGTSGTGGNGGGGTGGTPVAREWQGATLIEQDDTGNLDEHQLAGSTAGNAIVVWLQHDGERNDVWANLYDPQTDWQTGQRIEHEAGDAVQPQAAVAPNGLTALAVWSQFDGSTYTHVRANHHLVVWQSEGIIVNLDNGWVAGAPQLVMYPGGAARVVWIERFRLEHAVWAALFTPSAVPFNEQWWEPERIDNPSTTLTDSGEPALAGYPDSGATAAWREVDEIGPSDFWSSRYDVSTGQWAEPELVETLDGVPFDPQVTMDGEGNAIAVWRQRHDTLLHYDIWANRWAPRP